MVFGASKAKICTNTTDLVTAKEETENFNRRIYIYVMEWNNDSIIKLINHSEPYGW